MKILVVSNLYPPHFIGGYELGCAWVADQMAKRGHEVVVLTSTYGLSAPTRDANVWRLLQHDFTPRSRLSTKLPRLEIANRKTMRSVLREVDPNVVHVWNPSRIGVSIGLIAQQLGYPTCHYVSDDWPTRADSWHRFTSGGMHSPLRRIAGTSARPLLKSVGLAPPEPGEIAFAQAVSEHIKTKIMSAASDGIRVAHAEVIRWGVELDRYPMTQRDRLKPTRLVLGGRLVADKGIHVVLEAVARLSRDGSMTQPLSVTVLGPVPEDAYGARLRELAANVAPPWSVNFAGRVAAEQMPAMLADHDLFVLPSIWHEPFSIMLVEAMAAGLACIGTDTGGTREIISDGRNGLLVPADDVPAMKAALARLLTANGFARELGDAARATVDAEFTLKKMVDRIEQSLSKVAAQPKTIRAAETPS